MQRTYKIMSKLKKTDVKKERSVDSNTRTDPSCRKELHHVKGKAIMWSSENY
jgi:hypothetical protein